MIKNIHHIGITVRDFEKMQKFYQDAFGFKSLGSELDIPEDQARAISGGAPRKPAMRIIMMQAGNCFLELMGNAALPEPDGSVPTRGYTQICIDVDDIEAEYDRLERLGMVWAAPAPVNFGNVKAVTGCDPEGNAFELVQTLRDWDCVLADLLPTRA